MTLPALHHKSFASFRAHGTKFAPFNPSTDGQREAHWKAFERVRFGFYGRMTTTVQAGLRDQLSFVLDNVRASRVPSQTVNAVRAATNRMRPIYERRIRSLYRAVVPTFAELTLEGFPKSARAPVATKQGDEDVDYWLDVADRYVTNHGGTLITAPNETTRATLIEAARVASQRGLESGWGMDRIAREIRDEADVVISQRRATVIARTEVIRASNYASLAGARSTDIALNKEWISTLDDRVRETHADADQQVVPLESSFTVGGFPAMYPADPALPARESVQCRCTLAYIPRT